MDRLASGDYLAAAKQIAGAVGVGGSTGKTTGQTATKRS
jgi:uncharacterized protein GlcG (DUF336 family)